MNEQAGGFTAPDIVGPSAEQEKDIHDEWDTFDQIELKMTQMGFDVIDKPQVSCPEITTELLTTANGHAYTEAYAAVQAWYNYAYHTMSRLDAMLIQVENERGDIDQSLRDDAQNTKVTGSSGRLRAMKPEEIKGMIAGNPRYRELIMEKQLLDQQKLLLDGHLKRFGRGLKLLSRQIELRKEDRGYTHGNNNLGARATPPGRMA